MYLLIIPALGGLRQKDSDKLGISLVYTASFMPAGLHSEILCPTKRRIKALGG